MPKKQAFIDKSGVKFVENFQKNQKIKKFPSRTEIRYLTAFMQKSQIFALLSEPFEQLRELDKQVLKDGELISSWFLFDEWVWELPFDT